MIVARPVHGGKVDGVFAHGGRDGPTVRPCGVDALVVVVMNVIHVGVIVARTAVFNVVVVIYKGKPQIVQSLLKITITDRFTAVLCPDVCPPAGPGGQARHSAGGTAVVHLVDLEAGGDAALRPRACHPASGFVPQRVKLCPGVRPPAAVVAGGDAALRLAARPPTKLVVGAILLFSGNASFSEVAVHFGSVHFAVYIKIKFPTPSMLDS